MAEEVVTIPTREGVTDSYLLTHETSATPRIALVTVVGGDPPQSDACEPLSPHGYYGREAVVAKALRACARAGLPPRNSLTTT